MGKIEEKFRRDYVNLVKTSAKLIYKNDISKRELFCKHLTKSLVECIDIELAELTK